MIDKVLVKKRFAKSLKSYEENAIIQKEMAQKLINLLDEKEFDSILEIGCSTGILTKLIKEQTVFKEFIANDIVDEASKYIQKIIPELNFISGDIEQIELKNKYNLIISNACLQWCNDIEKTIDKLINHLKENSILALTIFGDENFKEIKNILNIENKTYKIKEIKLYLEKYNLIKFEEEEKKLYFDSPSEILSHIKKTGVNAVKEMKMTKNGLKVFCEKYNELYKTKQGVCLTYNPVYIVIKNN